MLALLVVGRGFTHWPLCCTTYVVRINVEYVDFTFTLQTAQLRFRQAVGCRNLEDSASYE